MPILIEVSYFGSRSTPERLNGGRATDSRIPQPFFLLENKFSSGHGPSGSLITKFDWTAKLMPRAQHDLRQAGKLSLIACGINISISLK